MIPINTDTRAGRMLAAGRLTVTFRSPTGTHITLTAKCRAPQENGKWESSTLAEAKVIFIEVPNPEGWNDKVGKVTRAKGFTPDPNTDKARAYCAEMLLRYAAGQSLPPSLEVFEEDRCGRCGRALTDPVSIERGIGPECYGKNTDSQHEVKLTSKPVQDGGTGVKATLFTAPTDIDPGMHAVAAREAQERKALATDKKGVALGMGDWHARKSFLDEELRRENQPRGKQAKDATPALSSQLTTLPGETWEDIFGGTAAIEAAAAAHKIRQAAKLEGR